MAKTANLNSNKRVVSFTVENFSYGKTYTIKLIDGLYRKLSKFNDLKYYSRVEKLSAFENLLETTQNLSSDSVKVPELVIRYAKTLAEVHKQIDSLVDLEGFEKSRMEKIDYIKDVIAEVKAEIDEKNMEVKKNNGFNLEGIQEVVIRDTVDSLFVDKTVIQPLCPNKMGKIVENTKSLKEWKNAELERLNKILEKLQKNINTLESIDEVSMQEWMDGIVNTAKEYLNS